jgi:hypothetical protein
VSDESATIRIDDATVLIGVLAVLEGHLMDPAEDSLSRRMVARLHEDLTRLGYADDTGVDLSAVRGMGQRLRYAIGERTDDKR